ncbi:MAG: response regulator, partial [Candidatus Omnitrophica bacterium]|nr:response regulator [Candidatus Omnitrophota bacterium]MBD3268588.1 response regulator [Candidatus Omnitrophota bacterium]
MAYNILLVDDDRYFREEFSDFLEDYNVTGVPSGEKALEVLSKPNEVDLVILDVMLPDLRGTEVL